MNKIYLIITFFIFLRASTCFAVWEYKGYSGKDNSIAKEGEKNLIATPYPDSWDSFSDKQETICLCNKETEKELESAITSALGSPYQQPIAKKVTRGTKFVIAPKKAGEANEVEIYGLFLQDNTLLGKAYETMKKRMGRDVAYIQTDKAIYFAKKSDAVPSRAFLHLVRGYDDTASKEQ